MFLRVFKDRMGIFKVDKVFFVGVKKGKSRLGEGRLLERYPAFGADAHGGNVIWTTYPQVSSFDFPPSPVSEGFCQNVLQSFCWSLCVKPTNSPRRQRHPCRMAGKQYQRWLLRSVNALSPLFGWQLNYQFQMSWHPLPHNQLFRHRRQQAAAGQS